MAQRNRQLGGIKISCFKYSSDRINRLVQENKNKGMRKANMLGVYEDLKRLKPLVEEFFDRNIFYLDAWEGEAGYHGWLWDKDDGSMESMAEITGGITERFEEIYALILTGIGENMEVDT